MIFLRTPPTLDALFLPTFLKSFIHIRMDSSIHILLKRLQSIITYFDTQIVPDLALKEPFPGWPFSPFDMSLSFFEHLLTQQWNKMF